MIGLLTACGAVTSLGLSARASCAAMRGGLSRPRSLPFQVVDAESQELVPVIGHPVAGFTDGFQLIGRWVRLARGALSDLCTHPGVAPIGDAAFWERTGVLAVTAHPDDEIFLAEEGGARAALELDYLGALRRVLVGTPPASFEIVPLGHAGTATALGLTSARLAAGLDRVLILAADSIIDPILVQRLAAEHRLKCDEDPAGLMPGEAGVALLIESPSSARRRGASALAEVVAAATERERLRADAPSTGRALAACVGEVLGRTDAPRPYGGDLVLDLNGEEWRAREWGTALVRLGTRLGLVHPHLPATSVGDTGAASGALGVCLAAHLLARGTGGAVQLVVSRSEPGEVGCVGLRRAKV